MKAFAKRYGLLIALAAVIAFNLGTSVRQIVSAKADGECVLIHQPKDGCPKGYEPSQTARFTDAQGNHTAACWTANPNAPHCVDKLNPGESLDMLFDLRVPDEEPQEASVPGNRS